jgi:hypothetical protein
MFWCGLAIPWEAEVDGATYLLRGRVRVIGVIVSIVPEVLVPVVLEAVGAGRRSWVTETGDLGTFGSVNTLCPCWWIISRTPRSSDAVCSPWLGTT